MSSSCWKRGWQSRRVRPRSNRCDLRPWPVYVCEGLLRRATRRRRIRCSCPSAVCVWGGGVGAQARDANAAGNLRDPAGNVLVPMCGRHG
eukprot:4297685-Pleurochrysis_carterae.AAC.1